MGTTREALEAALAAEPESVALHSAYADLLIEEGDPRGEYIRLELALEDEGLTEANRQNLFERANVIRESHSQNWLGPLAEYLKLQRWQYAEGASYPVAITWRRGWIDRLTIHAIYPQVFRAATNCPLCKLLHTLRICHDLNLTPLIDEEPVGELISILNSLSFTILSIEDFFYWGDDLATFVVQNPFLERIESLTICRCEITDDGAAILASSPLVQNLTSLNLDNNYLSPIGIAALAEVGFDIGPQLDNPAWEHERHNTGWGADAD